MGPAPDAAAFVACGDLDSKVRLLDALSADEIEALHRTVQLARGSDDDMALIGSYRDLIANAKSSGSDGEGPLPSRGGLRRSGSAAYWNRATGEQDFECSGAAAFKADAGADYWDQVATANTSFDGPVLPSFNGTTGVQRAPGASRADVVQQKQQRPVVAPVALGRAPSADASFWDAMADNATT